MRSHPSSLTVLAGVLLVCSGATAQAQSASADAAPKDTTVRADPDAFFTGFWKRSNMLGDMGGLRSLLASNGITFTLQEQLELKGNVSGGIKRGATVNGLTTATLLLDTQTAFGWEGGSFNVSALQIHGQPLSASYLGTMQTASGIEATGTTRLWEIWYQQVLFGGAADIKLGQQSLDQEFLVSAGSSLFVNTATGWPIIPSVGLYAGGPAYPLSSLGVRLRVMPTRDITVLAGVFSDNPPGGDFAGDTQLRGSTRWGWNANFRTGALSIGELQYAVNTPAAGDMDDGTRPLGLPGLYKIGGYYDTASFPSPNAGVAQSLRGNYAIYGIMDQAIWRPDPDEPRVLGVYARVMAAPGDRNLVQFGANAGLTLKAPFAGRDGDTAGIGFGIARVGSAARAQDQATAAVGLGAYPVRSNEVFIEATYQAQVTPWLQVQPDIQYIIRPAGGVPDPNNANRLLRNALVLGVRTAITF